MAYTQPPKLTTEETETLLSENNTARLCSLDPDGAIHAVTIGYKYENGRLLIITPEASRKVRNLKRNRTVTVLVDTVGDLLSDFKGVMIQGKADVKEATFSEALSVAEAWMEGDVEAQAKRLFDLSKYVLISVEPERIATWDYGKDEEFAAVFEE